MPLVEVGHQLGELVDVQHAVHVVVAGEQADRACLVQGSQVAQRRSSRARSVPRAARRCRRRRCEASRRTPDAVTGNRLRSMPITGVIPEPAVTNRNRPPRVGSTKSPVACSRWTRVPGSARWTRWLLTTPSGTALTVIEMQAVGAGAVGQGVGAPLADPVDVHADAEVLARDVPGPVGAGLDHDRRGVGGLGLDRDDPAAERRAVPQRREQVEVVRRAAAGWSRTPRSARSGRAGRARAAPAPRRRSWNQSAWRLGIVPDRLK